MNKFLQYVNETLISLDIPVLIDVDHKPNYKGLKKGSNKIKVSQKK
ncbi:hypothetical protein [Olleya aquimaris]|uniref:Uncharacterized protein n=1 Tax=Olleya aquimaris TaxID=639310 RepID=A0A327RR73_9FLAO|nr:hypothetical protein [Olleya aquimaris]RAJ18164.1 hypothetical protein LY08_00438 [Olleya aquimaris]